MPWVQAMDADELLVGAAQAGIPHSQQYSAGKDISAALRWATEVADGGPLVVAGSLYLVSDVLRMQRRAESVKTDFTIR